MLSNGNNSHGGNDDYPYPPSGEDTGSDSPKVNEVSFQKPGGAGDDRRGSFGRKFSWRNTSWKARIAIIGLGLLAAGMCSWLLLNIFISPLNRLLGLPEVSALRENSPISSIQVFDRNDQFVCVLQGEEDRQLIALKEVSPSLTQALLASEDRSFYQHGGINFFNILRALLVNLQSGDIRQGGSTLTQQLVKNVFFSPEEWSTLQRKIKELFLTLEVERKYSKDEILGFYLNQVYWGKGSYGIQRAAQRYFNKDAAQLNIAESAYLVALLSSPSTLHQTETAYKLQRQIIRTMVEVGYITPDQAQKAINTELKFESAPGNLSKHPFYMSVVLDELRSRYSEHQLRHSGLKVYTALDPKVQAKAEEILAQGIKQAPQGISQGALVTIDVATGEVRAIVGGVGDFWEHQWNRAVSRHTLGSSFKPFVYMTAFNQGLASANSVVMDTPFFYEQRDIGELWAPKNFDKRFWGPITVRKALVNSRNIPTVRVARQADIVNVQQLAKGFGLQNIEPYLASALGSSAESPLDMANAYAAIARGGVYMKPLIITRVEDHQGKILEQNTPRPEKVVSSNVIYELINILIDVVQYGTGHAAQLPGREIAGKTGTADGSRDVWFIGFTPDTVTAVWGGNDSNQEASRYATGGGVMAGIWKNFMQTYYELNPMPAKRFPDPAPKKKLLIDPITGLLATNHTYSPEYREFIPGTEPSQYAPPPTRASINTYLREKAEETRYMFSDEDDEELLPEGYDPEQLQEDLEMVERGLEGGYYSFPMARRDASPDNPYYRYRRINPQEPNQQLSPDEYSEDYSPSNAYPDRSNREVMERPDSGEDLSLKKIERLPMSPTSGGSENSAMARSPQNNSQYPQPYPSNVQNNSPAYPPGPRAVTPSSGGQPQPYPTPPVYRTNQSQSVSPFQKITNKFKDTLGIRRTTPANDPQQEAQTAAPSGANNEQNQNSRNSPY